jgi:multiple sugar transport system permease protein
MRSSRRPRRRRSVVKIVVGLLIAAWTALPLYWALTISLETPAQIRHVPVSFLPQSITGGNYSRLLNHSSDTSSTFLRALLNSTVEATAVTVLTIAIGLPAAYAFLRVRTLVSRIAFFVVVFTIAVPEYFVLIPLFQMASSIHQVNTYQSVVLILCSSTMPLAVWILRSHIASIPVEIEDAARIDGAGTRTLLTRIVLPLAAPGCVAAGVVTFLAAWGAFLIPAVFSNTSDTQPLTVLIPQYAGKYAQDYGLQSAAAIIALLPPALLVLWLRKYLLSGLLAGAGK